MRGLGRLCVLLCLAAGAVCSAFAQGGAAGAFGGGGGFGGGKSGAESASRVTYAQGHFTHFGRSTFKSDRGSLSSKEYDLTAFEEYVRMPYSPEKSRQSESALSFSHSLEGSILSGHWSDRRIEIPANSILFAGASSEAFDVTLQLLDESGKLIAEGLDRSEQDLSAYISQRIKVGGTFVLRVKSANPATGGKFTGRYLACRSLSTNIGEPVSFIPDSDSKMPVAVSVHVSKGQFYAFKPSGTTFDPDATWPVGLTIMAQKGLNDAEFDAYTTLGRVILRAKAECEVTVVWISPEPFQFSLENVPVIDLGKNETQNLKIPADGFALFRTLYKADEPVHTRIGGNACRYSLMAAGDGPVEEQLSYGLFWLKSDSNHDAIRVFHQTNPVYALVENVTNKPTEATIENSTKIESWTPGQTISGNLSIGESRVFVLDSGKSELMRTLATSTSFQPRITIYDLKGQEQNSLCDRGLHNAGDDLYFPKADKFMVALQCDGDGGSGPFSLRRDSLPAEVCELGKAVNFELTGANVQLNSISLEKDTLYQVVVSNTEENIGLEVLDDEGQTMPTTTALVGKNRTYWFTPQATSRFRLWLHGNKTKAAFKITKYVG